MKVFLLCLALLSVGCSSAKKFPLVIVLGIDGMDPTFVGHHISDLPNLKSLMQEGEFKPLQTTMPPQSPVAWSTFSTGLDPAEHGLFDFVYRDPKTGKPFSSMGETEEPTTIDIGSYSLPLGSPRIRTFRKGTVFWKLLSDAGVPTKMLRMPVNYPPEKSKAISLAGMGVPDMRGTFGTYTFFTKIENDHAVLNVGGPPNPYLRDKTPTSVNIKVDVDPFENVARFTVQKQTFILRAGEWSEWIPVAFPHTNGMLRVYAKGFRPDFEVYVSPVNFNPQNPDAPISNPASESAQLANNIGLFYTQGMAEDTAAYRNGVFDRAEYLTQAQLVADEQIRILKSELAGFKQGFLFWHFSGVDQNSHMLWGKFDQELLVTYKLVDETIGWVKKNDPEATLIIMSDHGFNSFDRSVNLNALLKNSSAYALGLNGVYLNLAGREKNGTVAKTSAPVILQDIAKQILALRDTTNGKQAVARVWSPHPNFNGDIQYIPDLIVGFAPGYRSSWEGDLGNGSGPVISDNKDAWIGDHCIAPEFVPGVLISNKKSRTIDPQLKDLTVSILSLFGVPPAPQMNGKAIY